MGQVEGVIVVGNERRFWYGSNQKRLGSILVVLWRLLDEYSKS